MKFADAALIPLCFLHAGLCPAGPPPEAPEPVTLAFFISGMECGTCTAMITQSVEDVAGVTEVDLEIVGGLGRISFDRRAASAHQIAQAVLDALPVHGKPFVATMKFRVPEYARKGNAARVDAVFARHRDSVRVETLDRDRGEFEVHFLPLPADPGKAGPRGWHPDLFRRAIQDPPPRGLGLSFALVTDWTLTPPRGPVTGPR